MAEENYFNTRQDLIDKGFWKEDKKATEITGLEANLLLYAFDAYVKSVDKNGKVHSVIVVPYTGMKNIL